jgi:hypothetical protein
LVTEGGGVSTEANTAGGFLRRIITAAVQNTEEPTSPRAQLAELQAQLTELREELAKVNTAPGQNTEELRELVAQFRTELEEERSAVAQFRAKLEEALSRGFWRRLFGRPPRQTPEFGLLPQQTADVERVRADVERLRAGMERDREQTRGRIAFALLYTLLGVVLATLVYIAALSVSGVLGTQEVINVVHGVGTTLLAPIVGLIGAVIGFYYGGQTAVQSTEQARQAASETADLVANRAATDTAREVTSRTQEASSRTQEAAQAATEAATKAADKATEAAEAVVNQRTENTNG